MCMLSHFSHVQLFATPWTIAHQAPLSTGRKGVFPPGKNTGVDCHFLLQGIFPTQGWNPLLLCLLHWQAGSSPLVPPLRATTWLFNLDPACAQSCPTLFDPLDCSPPGSSVHEISQARILEWVAIFSFRSSSQLRDQTHISCVSCIGWQILYP